MTLGLAPRQADLFRSTAAYCDGRVAPESIYGILHRECFGLFPDEMFADLFEDVGRRSVPPMIVAVVMVLQRIEGLSDREAVDRFAFDARWKYAAGWTLITPVSCTRCWWICGSGCAGRRGRTGSSRRVLDSTPLYDAVTTMDTVMLIRSAIRGLLKAAGNDLAGELRAVLARDDDYAAAGKPACDYDDPAARGDLVDALARDARALLAAMEGRELGPALGQAAELLAVVTGQDLEQDPAGLFSIARQVAPDRVISIVDPQARHGHKTSARGFDGYKGHVAVDPDSEIITATAVTPGNSGDAEAAAGLLADLLAAGPGAAAGQDQPPPAPKGHFPKDRFVIDLQAGTVACPAGITAVIRARSGRHAGAASFGAACRTCPLAAQCTTAPYGQTITIGPHEARLAAARIRQADPAWKAGYRATRPKVERKISHLMRRRHGGRRARVRGKDRVAADFALLAAAVNLARLGVPGLACERGTWVVTS